MTPPISQASTRVQLLVPTALDAAFTYRADTALQAGTLVEASFAGRTLVGAVWSGEADATVPEAKLKPVARVLDFPPLPAELMQFIESVSAFTLAPRGAVLTLCGLAHAAKPVKKPYAAPQYNPALPTLSPEQQAAAEALTSTRRSLPILLDGVTGSGKTEVYFHAMAEVLGLGGEAGSVAPSPLRGGLGRGATDSSQPNPRPPTEIPLSTAPTTGKTARGNFDSPARGELSEPASPLIPDPRSLIPDTQILVLLPEIALTHQWVERFTKTFGAPPTLWHSQLTPTQRRKTWQAIARGEARVIVGARSALFLPFRNLKLIIVDEEHDPSYKQEDGVLYHARDMAVLRGRAAGANVILSSATPSLETLLNVQSGKYHHVQLPQRYGAASLPSVRLIDMLNNPPERGEFLSPAAKQAMLQTLARGEQVLLFLNRRGYAPLLLCRKCGHRFQCDHCSAWMVVHQKPEARNQKSEKTTLSQSDATIQTSGFRFQASALHCHHCGTRKPVPPECPSCKAPHEQFAACGPGVERVHEEVQSVFRNQKPEIRKDLSQRDAELQASDFRFQISVLSSDESIDPDLWNQIAQGEIDILIGTQMVAKGHHFPRLTLVVVVDADMGLGGADLRAGERTYQLLNQLGGRAGREALAGEVLIQTYQPNHPIMHALTKHDRASVMQLETQIRQAGNWPPYGQLAAVLLDGVDEAKVRTAAQKLAQSAPHDKRLTVLGPAPAPLSKLRGQYRYRLLIKADKTIHLQRTLSAWLTGQKFPGVRVKLDVNPYYFL